MIGLILAVSVALDEELNLPPVIRLPRVPVLVEPDRPKPSPIDPEEREITTINPDEWYVIESSIELIVIQSPDGLLKIGTDAGPIKFRGKFADGLEDGDGNHLIETRTYSQPFVYSLVGSKPGKCELIIVPVGVKTADAILRQAITVSGVGPNPPPDPVDPEDPDPPQRDDVLSQSHEADRASQVEILRELAAKDLPRDPTGLKASKDFVNAERIKRRIEDFIPLTDAIGQAIFDGTVAELADELEGVE